MDIARIDGVELEYEVTGAGAPVLLIPPIVADAFRPLAAERALVGRHRLIRYHKRGSAGSTHTPSPVSIADHAADAAALLAHLGAGTAHVVGHSSGGAVALQLAADRPELVRTLTLLEAALLDVPSGAAFMRDAGPAFAAYAAGDHRGAVETFLALVSGFPARACRAVMERTTPGGVDQTVADADTVFGIELPSLVEWPFDAGHAARIAAPVLQVRGARTLRLFDDGADALGAWIPWIEDHTVPGVGHLLQMERPAPFAAAIGDFLARHPMTAAAPRPEPATA